jgi:signal transduction histidine kinase/CheY-like chemotaxis protein
MRKFKKDVTGDELLSLVLDTADQIRDVNDLVYVVQRIEKMILKAFSAEWLIIWFKDRTKDILYSNTVDTSQRVEIPINKGLIGKAFNMGEAVVLKQAIYENAYDESVDNILGVQQKDVIFYPIKSDDGNVTILLQISNNLKDIQQFMQKDLEKIEILETHISPILRVLQKGSLDNKSVNHNPKNFTSEVNQVINNLIKEKEKAEMSLASSTRFLAEVAHEIRTPMNAVMGFLELLQIDEKNEEKSLYIDTAIKSGTMMVALVNDLLDFAKIEQGMMELESLVFNPIEEYTTMGPLFSSRMKKHNIYFNTFIDPNMPKKIRSDPHRVKQVLSNLIGNAVKFTPKNGRILLSVTFDKKREELLFSVKDNGKGIAKDKQTQIFEAFKQEHNSTSREYGGTGLGLSISQKLTNLYGSKLQVQSREGQGSRFFFSIPLKGHILEGAMQYDKKLMDSINIKLIFKEKCNLTSNVLEKYFNSFGVEREQIEKVQDWNNINKDDTTHIFCGKNSLDKESIQTMLNSGITVTIMKNDVFKNYKDGLKGNIHELPCAFGADKLYKVMFGRDLLRDMDACNVERNLALIVDDNSINIQFLKAVLDKLGVDIESATNGQIAIEKYKKSITSIRPYQIIFMDENMPIMGGVEATKNILEIEKKNRYLHIPIIGLSGDSTEEHRTKCIEVGMDDSITKPVHIKDISNILERFIDKK